MDNTTSTFEIKKKIFLQGNFSGKYIAKPLAILSNSNLSEINILEGKLENVERCNFNSLFSTNFSERGVLNSDVDQSYTLLKKAIRQKAAYNSLSQYSKEIFDSNFDITLAKTRYQNVYLNINLIKSKTSLRSKNKMYLIKELLNLFKGKS